MNHLTDEQFEQALDSEAAFGEHLAACEACRARLAEHRAVRGRLRAAFASVAAGEDLAARLREQLAAAGTAGGSAGSGRGRSRVLRLRAWPALAAAAALVLAVSAVFVLSPSRAAAADELAAIHEHNLTHLADAAALADLAAARAYFREQAGFAPALPEGVHEILVPNCGRCRFRSRAAATYIVRTKAGPVSIVVLSDPPESLKMARRHCDCGPDCRCVEGVAGDCRIVARRQGGRTYVAVGDCSHRQLAELVHRLVEAE